MAQINLKPILYDTSAFDATIEFALSFRWSGNQAFKNRLIVKKNDTNELIYDQTQTTQQLRHAIPANSLTNGICYNAQIQVYDKDNNESLLSEKILFYCYTTPTFQFSNISPNQIVQNSFIDYIISYSQPEGEVLNSYQVYLYDSHQLDIYHTGLKYNTDNLSGRISGLSDGTQYYVRAVGETLNRMSLDTGFIPISVSYITPSLFSLVELENLELDGAIRITSNIISIVGTSNPDPPTYINNAEIDLTQSGHFVNFSEGFSINKNFLLNVVGRNFADYSIILEASNGKHNLTLRYMKSKFADQTEEKAYFILEVTNSFSSYIILSNLIQVPAPTDKIFIWLKKVDDIYELKVEITNNL